MSILPSFLLPKRVITVTAVSGSNLRPGRWVVYRGRVAILHELRPIYTVDANELDGSPRAVTDIDGAIIHLVDASGFTVDQAHVPLDELRQATIKEIPKVRVPNKKVALLAGYREA